MITDSFRRFYFGAILADIDKNLTSLRWQNIELNLRVFNVEGLHQLFKIVTYRGDKSLTQMDNKEVVAYLEDIRVLLADNGYILTVDNEEWERVMKSIKRSRDDKNRR